MLSWVNSLHEELLALKACLEKNLVVEREREVKSSDIVISSRISLVVVVLRELSKSLLNDFDVGWFGILDVLVHLLVWYQISVLSDGRSRVSLRWFICCLVELQYRLNSQCDKLRLIYLSYAPVCELDI